MFGTSGAPIWRKQAISQDRQRIACRDVAVRHGSVLRWVLARTRRASRTSVLFGPRLLRASYRRTFTPLVVHNEQVQFFNGALIGRRPLGLTTCVSHASHSTASALTE